MAGDVAVDAFGGRELHELDEWEWERLGESFEFGYVLLESLSRWGWTVTTVGRGFAGDGVIVCASRGPITLERTGATVADIAASLFCDALRYQRAAT